MVSVAGLDEWISDMQTLPPCASVYTRSKSSENHSQNVNGYQPIIYSPPSLFAVHLLRKTFLGKVETMESNS